MPSIAEVLGPCDIEVAFIRLRFDEERAKKLESIRRFTRKADGRGRVIAHLGVWKQDQDAGDVRRLGVHGGL